MKFDIIFMAKQLIGKVVSDKMEKTVVVSVETKKKVPKYRKILKRHKKYKAHNEKDAKLDDLVKIQQTRPLSRDKRWEVVEIVRE